LYDETLQTQRITKEIEAAKKTYYCRCKNKVNNGSRNLTTFSCDPDVLDSYKFSLLEIPDDVREHVEMENMRLLKQ